MDPIKAQTIRKLMKDLDAADSAEFGRFRWHVRAFKLPDPTEAEYAVLKAAVVEGVPDVTDPMEIALYAAMLHREDVRAEGRRAVQSGVDPHSPFAEWTDEEVRAELESALAEERAAKAAKEPKVIPAPKAEAPPVPEPIEPHPVVIREPPPFVDSGVAMTAREIREQEQQAKAHAAALAEKIRAEAQARRDHEEAMRSPNEYQGPMYGSDWQR